MNFSSRFFNNGFKYSKNSFKSFFKKETGNFTKNNFNLFTMNKIQVMNYISIVNSCKLTNATYFMENINTSQTSIFADQTDLSATELVAKKESILDPNTLIKMLDECVLSSMRRTEHKLEIHNKINK
jgi:hypothetical protein